MRDLAITLLVLKYLCIGHFFWCDAFKPTSPNMLKHSLEATLVHNITSTTRRFDYTSHEHPLFNTSRYAVLCGLLYLQQPQLRSLIASCVT